MNRENPGLVTKAEAPTEMPIKPESGEHEIAELDVREQRKMESASWKKEFEKIEEDRAEVMSDLKGIEKVSREVAARPRDQEQAKILDYYDREWKALNAQLTQLEVNREELRRSAPPAQDPDSTEIQKDIVFLRSKIFEAEADLLKKKAEEDQLGKELSEAEKRYRDTEDVLGGFQRADFSNNPQIQLANKESLEIYKKINEAGGEERLGLEKAYAEQQKKIETLEADELKRLRTEFPSLKKQYEALFQKWSTADDAKGQASTLVYKLNTKMEELKKERKREQT